MAALTQTITPTPDVQLFSGLPGGTNNIYPRARVSFDSSNAITLKAAANTNTVIYIFNLPENFAYRFDQSYVSFNVATSTEISQIEDLGVAIISLDNGSTIFARSTLASKGLISDTTVAGSQKCWVMEDPYQEVHQAVIPLGSTANPNIRWTYNLFDNDNVNETVALAADIHVSFLQYDIQQIFHVSVNAPQPVTVV